MRYLYVFKLYLDSSFKINIVRDFMVENEAKWNKISLMWRDILS